MKKYFLIIFLLVLDIFPTISAKDKCIACLGCEKSPLWSAYQESYFLKTIYEFEDIMNKDMPRIQDYIIFNHGLEDPLEKNMSCENSSWETLKKWGFSLKEYKLLTKERPKDDNKTPSCYLLRIQKALKGKNKMPIKIYIRNKELKCYKLMDKITGGCWLLAVDIEAIVKQGNKYKEITFKLPCNLASEELYGRIIDIKIDDKWLIYGKNN